VTTEREKYDNKSKRWSANITYCRRQKAVMRIAHRRQGVARFTGERQFIDIILRVKHVERQLPDIQTHNIAPLNTNRKGKERKRITVCATSTAPLRELTCHMGSHSITCRPVDVTFPPLRQPIKAGTRFSDPRWMQG